jgi:hypothetical protein
MKRYYAKADTWFKEGSEAYREEEMFSHGSLTDGKTGEKTGSAIYRGIYVVGSNKDEDGNAGYDVHWYGKGYKDGDEVEMHEHSTDDEFFVVEE